MINIKKELYIAMSLLVLPSLLMRLAAPDLIDSNLLMLWAESILANIPLILVVIIPSMLCTDKRDVGVVILSSVIFYFALTYSSKFLEESISYGIFGGVISATTSYIINKHLKKLKVPIIVMICYITGLVFGISIGVLYIQAQAAVITLAKWLTTIKPSIASMLFGIFDTLLKPFNLNGYLHEVIWYKYGEYKGVTGDYFRYLAGDQSSGIFMVGYYPIIIFGLMGFITVPVKKMFKLKQYEKGILVLLIGSISLLTGISEPIEILILFLSPVIYIIHSLLTGISFMICSYFDIRAGFSFAPGLIDYIINVNKSFRGAYIVPLGIMFYFIYYLIYEITYNFKRVRLRYLYCIKKIKFFFGKKRTKTIDNDSIEKKK